MAQGRVRIEKTPSAQGASRCMSGYFGRAPFRKPSEKAAGRQVSTMISPSAVLRISAPGSLDATCLAPFVVPGQMKSWKGWWGDNPPYHVPVFVLTKYARSPVSMEGGTTFHFVTDGIHAALQRAADAANGRDIRLGGGVATIRQYLRKRLVDEMHVAISPVLLGAGEHLFFGIDLPQLGYRPTEHVPTENATHIVLKRSR